VGVDDGHALLPQQPGQPQWAAQVQPRLAADEVNREPVGPQFLAERADLVQAGEHEPERPAEPPGQTGGQHLGPTDVHRVEQLADGDRLGGDHDFSRASQYSPGCRP
jgi:hypothetical protein